MKKKFESPRFEVKKIQASNILNVSCQGDCSGDGITPTVCPEKTTPPCGPDF